MRKTITIIFFVDQIIQSDPWGMEKADKVKFEESKLLPPHFETPIEAIAFSARPLERWFEKYEPTVRSHPLMTSRKSEDLQTPHPWAWSYQQILRKSPQNFNPPIFPEKSDKFSDKIWCS